MIDNVRELWAFLRERRKLWLLPLVLVLLMTGVLLVIAEGGMVLPFLYALF